MKQNLAAALLLVTMAAHAMADGKMYWREKVPPAIPYQRALILFKDGTETLVLQSQYRVPKAQGTTALGWVVPVPAAPQLASMPADLAQDMFMFLSRSSGPRVTQIAPTALAVLFLAMAGLSILSLLLCAIASAAPFPSWFKERRGRLIRIALLGLLACVVIALVIPAFATARGSMGVDVVSEQRVGIYDIRIVSSNKSRDLISWLNANKFAFGAADQAAFDSYISRGWCFVVAKINPADEQDEHEIVSEGLAAPLILRFPVSTPVYPVALTGTGGVETELLIYLATTAKMTCGDRLTLRFAGKMPKYTLDLLPGATEPEAFFTPGDLSPIYLCKFKKTLGPLEMREDITFTPDPDHKPYREHVVKW